MLSQHRSHAGFLTHTDAQIGRLVDGLERMGVMDNTLLLILSDNGASAEGGQHGTFNVRRTASTRPSLVPPSHGPVSEQSGSYDGLGRIAKLPALLVGMARGQVTPRCGCEALRVAGRHAHAHGRELVGRNWKVSWWRNSPAVLPPPSTFCRPCSTHAASRRPKRVDGVLATTDRRREFDCQP